MSPFKNKHILFRLHSYVPPEMFERLRSNWRTVGMPRMRNRQIRCSVSNTINFHVWFEIYWDYWYRPFDTESAELMVDRASQLDDVSLFDHHYSISMNYSCSLLHFSSRHLYRPFAELTSPTFTIALSIQYHLIKSSKRSAMGNIKVYVVCWVTLSGSTTTLLHFLEVFSHEQFNYFENSNLQFVFPSWFPYRR